MEERVVKSIVNIVHRQLVASLVIATQHLTQGLLELGLANLASRCCVAAVHQLDQVLVSVEQPPGIAISVADQPQPGGVRQRRRGECNAGAVDQQRQLRIVQGLQHVHSGT
jgi:hypothetical protein